MVTKKKAKKSKKTAKKKAVKKTAAKKTAPKKKAAKTKKSKKAGKAKKVKKTAAKKTAPKKKAAKKPAARKTVKKAAKTKPAPVHKGDPDLRRHPRVHLKQTVSVADDHALALAEVVDITVGGISVNSESRIERGSRFFVVFPGAGNINENEVEAEVLRCHELHTDSPFKYQIGARFVNANEKYVKDAIVLIKGN